VTSLERTDGGGAQPGALGKLLLAQAGRLSQPPQVLAEL
jgi:hypothetical protein